MEKWIDKRFITDEDMVIRAQEGNKAAEEYLINKYRAMAKEKSKLYYITGGDKEDVIQEGMIGIFKAIRDFDSGQETSFKTFVELCVTRQIINAIKKANREKHQILNESVSLSNEKFKDEKHTLSESIPTGDDMNPETQTLIKEVVQYIRENEEDIFSPFESRVWMEILKGKSYREIAFQLGKNPKTIDNAIQRVKKKVSGYLRD